MERKGVDRQLLILPKNMRREIEFIINLSNLFGLSSHSKDYYLQKEDI